MRVTENHSTDLIFSNFNFEISTYLTSFSIKGIGKQVPKETIASNSLSIVMALIFFSNKVFSSYFSQLILFLK